MQTGTQILTGFLLALAFQPAFADLDDGQRPSTSRSWSSPRSASIVALAPVALHRFLFQQRAKPKVVRYGHAALITSLVTVSVLVVGVVAFVFDVVVDRSAAIVAVIALASVDPGVCGSSRPPSCGPASLAERTGDCRRLAHHCDRRRAVRPDRRHGARTSPLIAQLVATASDRGASLVVFPEYSSYFVDPFDESLAANAEDIDGPFVARADRARRRLRRAHRRRACSSGRPTGGACATPSSPSTRRAIVATYRKLHLYDAFGQRESDWVEAGRARPSRETFELDGLRFGLMTCYDLRFPEVGRLLADAGAEVFLVPAEWVRGPLKEHHWRTLRARAGDREHRLRRGGRSPAAARASATR